MGKIIPMHIIQKREIDLGTYRLSIEMDERFLSIHEFVQLGGHDFVEGLWIYKYLAFRDASHSLKQVQKGVICINRDCHWENDDGSCYLHVERTYLARSEGSCTIYELSGSYIRKITLTVNDLEKILTMYNAFLAQTEEE